MSRRPLFRSVTGWLRLRGYTTLRARLLIYFGALFAVLLIGTRWVEIYGVPFTGLEGGLSQERARAYQSLNLVADLKKERLQLWLQERMDDTKVIAESNVLRSYVMKLRTVIAENMALGRQGDELWAGVRSEKAFLDLHQHLSLVMTTYGVYEAIQIADASTGTIIASTRNADLGASLWDQGSLATLPPFPGYTRLSLTQDPQSGEPGLMMSLPMMAADTFGAKGDRVVAVVAVQVNLDDMIKPILHTGGGLGETGEALLVNQDAVIITSLKHPLADGSKAKPLEYHIKARPAVLAARGAEGLIVTEDYRGVPVVAAYRHIRISPDMGWGMVVKMDSAEAFAFQRRELTLTSLWVAISLLLAFVAAGLLARRITDPLRSLQLGAQSIARGNLGYRLSPSGGVELEGLATAFNDMATRLQKYYSELEQAVVERTGALQTANDELESMVFIVSHDLRSPIISIQGFISNLSRDYAQNIGDEGRFYLERIVANTLHLESLIDELLELSRVGRQAEPREVFDTEGLVAGVVAELGPQLQGTGTRVAIAEGMPRIYGEKRRLRQAFVNLVGNALRFMGEQSNPHIEVGGEDAGESWHFWVRDNGMGISEQDQGKVFMVFQTLGRVPEKEGTGVGLAIVKKVAESHGGRAWVESEGAGMGSTFHFTIAKPQHKDT